MKSLEQFLSDYLGKSKGYPEGSYIGECLSIVKLYIKECFGISPPASGSGSAYGYWSNFPNPLGEVFEKVENTPDLIPEKGWIVIWQPWSTNKYGHIAICGDECTKNILHNYTQNWSSKNFTEEICDYDDVVGFLKPKSSIIQEMTEEQKRILDYIGNKTEGDVREAFGALAEKPVREGQIQTLTEKVLSLDKFVKDLQDRVMALESDLQANLDLVKDWQSKYTTANKQLENKNKELEEMTSEKNKYKGYYEKALEKTIDKYSALELFTLSIKKLFKK